MAEGQNRPKLDSGPESWMAGWFGRPVWVAAGILAVAILMGVGVAQTESRDLPVRQGQPSIAIQPSPEGRIRACLEARRGPLLVRRAGNELQFVETSDGSAEALAWPFGYTVSTSNGVTELLASDGHIVAREGDHIVVGGGNRQSGDIFDVCTVDVG